MKHAYLRYRQASVFGIINSTGGNVASMAEGSSKCVAPCLESAVVWDWRRGVEVRKMTFDVLSKKCDLQNLNVIQGCSMERRGLYC